MAGNAWFFNQYLLKWFCSLFYQSSKMPEKIQKRFQRKRKSFQWKLVLKKNEAYSRPSSLELGLVIESKSMIISSQEVKETRQLRNEQMRPSAKY